MYDIRSLHLCCFNIFITIIIIFPIFFLRTIMIVEIKYKKRVLFFAKNLQAFRDRSLSGNSVQDESLVRNFEHRSAR